MPEAKADALGGDARMTALVASAVTFQHATSSSAMALALRRRICGFPATAGSAGITLARRADAGTCSESGNAATDGFGKGVLSPHSFISLNGP